MEKQSLLIIGAGAAGLMAASKLSLHFDVTVLEAADHIGGRMHSIEIDGNIIETGAEFIHGNLPVTLKLLKDAGLARIASAGKMYRKNKESFIEEDDITEGWDELLKKMKKVKEDITLDQFLQKNYSDKENETIKKQVTGYAEGFDLADITKVSVKYLYKEWSGEHGGSHRIPAGYTALAAYLQQQANEDGCKLFLNKNVKLIKWKQNGVTVYTTGDEVYEANKLLITVPLNVLIKTGTGAHINFEPPITPYTEAAEEIGFGAVIKIIIKFKEIFWPPDAAFLLSNEKFFPTWWTQLPNQVPILTGWLGGPAAIELSSEEKDTILQKAVTSLASIFNKTTEEIGELIIFEKVFNWQADKISPGAYSYDTIKSAIAREILNTPLFKTIFFAGEALYKGDHPGTVEAALVSGELVAEKIKDTI